MGCVTGNLLDKPGVFLAVQESGAKNGRMLKPKLLHNLLALPSTTS
jgi:hypothetical protein